MVNNNDDDNDNNTNNTNNTRTEQEHSNTGGNISFQEKEGPAGSDRGFPTEMKVCAMSTASNCASESGPPSSLSDTCAHCKD